MSHVRFELRIDAVSSNPHNRRSRNGVANAKTTTPYVCVSFWTQITYFEGIRYPGKHLTMKRGQDMLTWKSFRPYRFYIDNIIIVHSFRSFIESDSFAYWIMKRFVHEDERSNKWLNLNTCIYNPLLGVSEAALCIMLGINR